MNGGKQAIKFTGTRNWFGFIQCWLNLIQFKLKKFSLINQISETASSELNETANKPISEGN